VSVVYYNGFPHKNLGVIKIQFFFLNITNVCGDNEQVGNLTLYVDRLDGLRRKPHEAKTMEDWLQLPDDYNSRPAQPGKKRVSLK
jgi:hypothetical protein